MSAAGSQIRLSDAQFERLRNLVRARIGMEIPGLRRRDLEGAVHDALEATGLHGVEALCRRLEIPSHAVDPLAPIIPKLTVGDALLSQQGAGGVVLAQDQASSVVYGMPAEAVACGAVDRVAPVTELASLALGAIAER